MNTDSFKRPFGILLALLAASVAGLGLVAFRYAYTGQRSYAGLVWNLFLAWIPLGFALLAWKFKTSRRSLVMCSLCWLLFFPNAPYIVTDIVHFRARPPMPVWFDLLLLQLFIWLGLWLGFVSLYWMQRLVAERFSGRVGWIFAVVVLSLSGFGIYLGRYGRWNSWDVLRAPVQLSSDIATHLSNPWSQPRTVGFSLLCSFFLLLTYLMVYSVTGLRSGEQTVPVTKC